MSSENRNQLPEVFYRRRREVMHNALDSGVVDYSDMRRVLSSIRPINVIMNDLDGFLTEIAKKDAFERIWFATTDTQFELYLQQPPHARKDILGKDSSYPNYVRAHAGALISDERNFQELIEPNQALEDDVMLWHSMEHQLTQPAVAEIHMLLRDLTRTGILNPRILINMDTWIYSKMQGNVGPSRLTAAQTMFNPDPLWLPRAA